MKDYLDVDIFKKDFIHNARKELYNAQILGKRTMPVLLVNEDDFDLNKCEQLIKSDKQNFIGTMFGLKMYSYYQPIPKIGWFNR